MFDQHGLRTRLGVGIEETEPHRAAVALRHEMQAMESRTGDALKMQFVAAIAVDKGVEMFPQVAVERHGLALCRWASTTPGQIL